MSAFLNKEEELEYRIQKLEERVSELVYAFNRLCAAPEPMSYDKRHGIERGGPGDR